MINQPRNESTNLIDDSVRFSDTEEFTEETEIIVEEHTEEMSESLSQLEMRFQNQYKESGLMISGQWSPSEALDRLTDKSGTESSKPHVLNVSLPNSSKK